jgi:hypothetical protein
VDRPSSLTNGTQMMSAEEPAADAEGSQQVADTSTSPTPTQLSAGDEKPSEAQPESSAEAEKPSVTGSVQRQLPDISGILVRRTKENPMTMLV